MYSFRGLCLCGDFTPYNFNVFLLVVNYVYQLVKSYNIIMYFSIVLCLSNLSPYDLQCNLPHEAIMTFEPNNMETYSDQENMISS